MIFVDTSHLIALAIREDELHPIARAWSRQLAGPFLTTEFVLWEFINRLSSQRHRTRAHAFIKHLRINPRFRIVPLDRALFQNGVMLHSARQDKNWSLTDCISFVVMDERGIRDALPNDRHFEQAGYRVLLREMPPTSGPPTA